MSVLLLGIVAIAWDGEFLYVARPGGVDVYRDGRRVRALGEEGRTSICLAARGKRLAEGGGRAGERGDLRLWEGGRLVWTSTVHADLVYAAAWSADGARLYTAGGDRTIGVVDAATGELKGRLEGHTGAVLALAVSGELLVSGGADATIRVWKDGRLLRTIANHGGGVQALAFAPDGIRLASGSADRTVRIWQPELGRLMKIVRGHDEAVTDLAWDGERLWTACADGKLRRVDPEAASIVEMVDGGADWVQALCPAEGRLYWGPAEGPLRWK